MPRFEMLEAERLSLDAANAIAVEMDQERLATGCSYSEAARRVLAREAHLKAGLAGDTQKFAELTQRGRSVRLATPASGRAERRFRRAGPPRVLSRRPIRDRSELREGETLCVTMTAAPGAATMFAEVVG